MEGNQPQTSIFGNSGAYFLFPDDDIIKWYNLFQTRLSVSCYNSSELYQIGDTFPYNAHSGLIYSNRNIIIDDRIISIIIYSPLVAPR